MNKTDILQSLEALDRDSRLTTPAPGAPAPDRKTVIGVIKDLQALLFPGYYRCERALSPAELLTRVETRLGGEIAAALRFRGEGGDPIALTDAFLSALPTIKELLLKDIEALYLGDPAAKCREEILLCYPGFYAISIYRMAHELYRLGVPLLPRIMTEYAHEKTGIDIHAGAAIGEYFFIDHGTGIVVGETTVIGDHVKLYQGVTLGALSPRHGHAVTGKRHPTVGDNATIYSGASILGGKTVIGANSVIGGNSFITESIAPNTKASTETPRMIFRVAKPQTDGE